jgi:alkyldihydroxyacetonephosphate synthase
MGESLPKPVLVLWPETVDEIIESVKLANKYKFRLVPYGGGSGVNGAALCDGSVVIDLRRMNNIISLSEEDLIVVVESGIYLKEIEEFLNRRGYTTRHIPQSYPEAVIGGLISTSSIGQYSTKYGGIEDMVLNLEVVTPSGKVTWLRKNTVPRSAAGPDLKSLFIGGEGVFGIITKATLKIRPLPKYIWKNAYTFKDFIEANRIAKDLIQRGVMPAVLRIYDKESSNLRFGLDENIMLLIVEENDKDMFRAKVEAISKTLHSHKGREVGDKYVDKWLKKRFDTISEVTSYLIPMGLWFDTIETATLWSNFPIMYNRFKEGIGHLKGVIAILAHTSHFYLNGVCIYFTIVFERSEELYWNIWRKAISIILNHGGSISHHHGVGKLRSRWLPEELEGGYQILRIIKNALDPEGVVGRGWLL